MDIFINKFKFCKINIQFIINRKGQKYSNFIKLIKIYNKREKIFNLLFYYLIKTLYIMISNFNNAYI